VTESDTQALTEILCQKRWPIARYRFVMRVTEALHLPEYGGSTIRGAFGHALRKTACMTKLKSCPGCPLQKSCPYAVMFESQPPQNHVLQNFSQIPHPYIFEAPLGGEKTYFAGEKLSFDLVLIGQSRSFLSLVIYAVQRCFRFHVGHGKAELEQVLFESDNAWLPIYDTANPRIIDHDAVLMVGRDNPLFQKAVLTLNFNTPLRIQKDGKLLDSQSISSQALLMALVRRISLLMEFFDEKIHFPFQDLSQLATQPELRPDAKWSHWVRFSSRQKQKMTLSGMQGSLTLTNLPPIFIPLLFVGSYTHVGKSASFGLGGYTLTAE